MHINLLQFLATLLEVYKQILEKRGLRGASLRGVNEDQLAQIAHIAAKLPPKQQTPEVSIKPADIKAPPEIRRQPSGKLRAILTQIIWDFRKRSWISNGTKRRCHHVL
jgi:hypothetical protein